LVYALVELQAPGVTEESAPSALNVSLVLDCSTSMKGDRIETVKVTAIEIIRKLRPQDILSIVTFSDRAAVLLPAGPRSDVRKVEISIHMLGTGGGTEIYQGLKAGYDEVQKCATSSSVNHIILLTDGHTYGDEAQCLSLAKIAQEQGIGISGLGVGSEWNDALLDQLAGSTGGSTVYIARDQDIKRFLEQKFYRLGQIYANSVSHRFKREPGVELQYAFRLQPEPGCLELNQEDGQWALEIGNISMDLSLSFILEFQINPIPTDAAEVTLADGRLTMDILSTLAVGNTRRLTLARLVCSATEPEMPPAVIIQALSRLTLYRMQERARQDISADNIPEATRRLKSLAMHLFSQGEYDLVCTVLQEVQYVQQTHALSATGGKHMKYGTRNLLLPASIEDGQP
jgi:Ca-activated chloride channel family protein